MRNPTIRIRKFTTKVSNKDVRLNPPWYFSSSFCQGLKRVLLKMDIEKKLNTKTTKFFDSSNKSFIARV
jgi:hypothetical protein